MKVMSMYKCQMCGQLIKLGNSGEMQPSEMKGAVDKFIYMNQLNIRNVKVVDNMFMSHQCKDGRAGLAMFIGLMPER